jgi:hypothetical protein
VAPFIAHVNRSCVKAGKYVERRTAEGKSKMEIIRCLKRYAAREAYYLIRQDAHHRAAAGRHTRGTAR